VRASRPHRGKEAKVMTREEFKQRVVVKAGVAFKKRIQDLTLKLSGWAWKGSIEHRLNDLNEAIKSAADFNVTKVEPFNEEELTGLSADLCRLKSLEMVHEMFDCLKIVLVERGVPEEFFEGLEMKIKSSEG